MFTSLRQLLRFLFFLQIFLNVRLQGLVAVTFCYAASLPPQVLQQGLAVLCSCDFIFFGGLFK